MAYYLTAQNKEIVEILAEQLKRVPNGFKGPVKIRVNNPRKLEHIVRSAVQLEEYSWIGQRFVIKDKPGELWFVERELVFEFGESEPEYNTDQVDFFTILNILLLQDKFNINFSQAILEEGELEKLQEWGNNHNYEIRYENNILKVKKINA